MNDARPKVKPKGKHPQNRLTDAAVRAAGPGYHADGGNLYLKVDESGARRWCVRLVFKGKRKECGLGGYPLVTLSEARTAALERRRAAKNGIDPTSVGKELAAPTFEEAAAKVHAEKAKSFRNKKHAAQWLSTLEQYVFPQIGKRVVSDIETPDVVSVLSPVWLEKPETARRVRQRIGSVMAWSKAKGYRTGQNPVDDALEGLPKQPKRTKHHAALPFQDVPAFVVELQGSDVSDAVKLALEFTILTVARTSEALNALKAEIDYESKIWTVPPERMKSNREHRVPLPDRCVEILREAEKLPGGDYIFPGVQADKPLSNMAMLEVMKRKRPGFTVHGFRSSFRDWAAERTNYPRETAERALAHVIKDKTEAAYERTTLLEKRRKLMAAWAAHVSPKSADVVQISAGSAS